MLVVFVKWDVKEDLFAKSDVKLLVLFVFDVGKVVDYEFLDLLVECEMFVVLMCIMCELSYVGGV